MGKTSFKEEQSAGPEIAGLKIEHTAGGVARLRLSGSWRLRNARNILGVIGETNFGAGIKWKLDGQDLTDVDTAGAMLLLHTLRERGIDSVDLEELTPRHKSIVRLAMDSIDSPCPLKEKQRFGFIAVTGKGTLEVVHTVGTILGFIGHSSTELAKAIVTPKLFRGKELVVQLEAVGLNAVPIVALVTFLIGIVVAYLSGVQIERYGANIFVVDGISLAMCRELSPILVAIIVAGRSGSAFTAQLGAMKLNEEIEAIVSLGLLPARVLVLPRILALMISMPLLVFVGDVSGILGGMLIADFRLGVTETTFIQRLRIVLLVKSLLVGIVKAPVFAFFIATIGCSMGLSVEPNARSLGESTTATVVRSIVAVILLNAAFAILFSELHI